MKSSELLVDTNHKNLLKNILIVGLGKSGISSVKYLAKYKDFFGKKISISVYDKFKSVKEQKLLLKDLEIDEFYSGTFDTDICKENSYVVLSPGVSQKEVICKGIFINDIFLFLDYIERISSHLSQIRIVGITGTNGKTTTSYFLKHLMIRKNFKAHTAGNIGVSPLDLIDKLKDNDVVILELSSFQLKPFIDIAFPRKLDIGILLNISPDHLDVHKDMNEYLNSKKALLRYSKRTIINIDLGQSVINEFNDITFGHSSPLANETKEKNWPKTNYNLITDNDSQHIIDNHGFKLNVERIKIPGKHNLFNIMAGIATFRCFENDFDGYENILSSFQGIPHRIEWTKKINGVDYFNDSKGTNVASTIAALESFKNKRIILIAGGDLKKQNLFPLKACLRKNVIALFLIGKDADHFKEIFEDIDNLNIAICSSMEDAIFHAYDLAKKGDIVLLSPACASLDMYSNYVERGNHFKAIVNQIIL